MHHSCRFYCVHSVLLVIIAIITVAMGGCFSYHKAQGATQSPVPMPEDAWPSFDLTGVEDLVDTPKVIERLIVNLDTLRSPWKERGQEGVELMRNMVTDDLEYALLDDHGLVRVWRDRRDGDLNPVLLDTGKPRVSDFDQNASYLIGPTAIRKADYAKIDKEIRDKKPLRSLSSIVYGLEPSDVTARWQLKHGLRMAVPEIVPEEPRGLIIHITGLIETKYEHRLTNRLRGYGYASAYLESATFLIGPNARERRVRNAERSKWIDEHQNQRQRDKSKVDMPEDLTKQTRAQLKRASDAYVTSLKEVFERADKELPSIEDGFQIHPDTDVSALGKIIAHAVDDTIAEHAYAVEALIRASDHLHPELAGQPVVVLGYSAGALVSPAAVARLKGVYPSREIRMILVGGGGDLVSAAVGSSFGSRLLKLKPKAGPEPTQEQIDELIEAYIDTVRLDPLVVAPAIRDIPTLHLYANKDAAVPTATAKEFNAAHGHVDELRHLGDHGTLFYFASGQAGKIRSWLNKLDGQQAPVR